MAQFKFGVLVDPYNPTLTARVSDGATNVPASFLGRLDAGKFLRLTADSQYGLCAVGQEIEGFLVVADDQSQASGFALGSINMSSRARVPVTFDGEQASGAGPIVIGDYVVAGTITVRGTVLPGPVRVRKATAAATGIVFKWRVVSMNGTSAVGQTGLIERVL